MKLYAIVKIGEELDDIRDFYNLYITEERAKSDLAHEEFDYDAYNLTEEEEDMEADEIFEVKEIEIADDDLAEAFDNMWAVERVSAEDTFNKLWAWLPDNIKNDFLKNLDWKHIDTGY